MEFELHFENRTHWITSVVPVFNMANKKKKKRGDEKENKLCNHT